MDKTLLQGIVAVVCGMLGAVKAASYARQTGVTLQGVVNLLIGGLIGWAVTDILVPTDGKIGQVVTYSLMAGVVGGYVLDALAALTPKIASAVLVGWIEKVLKGFGIDVDLRIAAGLPPKEPTVYLPPAPQQPAEANPPDATNSVAPVVNHAEPEKE